MAKDIGKVVVNPDTFVVPKGFELVEKTGRDGRFYEANQFSDGETLVVLAKKNGNPGYISYKGKIMMKDYDFRTEQHCLILSSPNGRPHSLSVPGTTIYPGRIGERGKIYRHVKNSK